MSLASAFTAIKDLDKGVLLTILVAALGYFVDVFDLLLFSAVRVASLKDIGVPDAELLATGVYLINLQMVGLVVGGLLWGVLGDKLGRLSTLLGSILLYSLANLGNAFVDSVDAYAVLRFLAGVGLAGELGIGVTLVSEIMPTPLRGLGTAFIATVGMLGAVFAGLVAEYFGWRTVYALGGIMGLALLVLRMGLKESALFRNLLHNNADVKRGSLVALLGRRSLLKRYLASALVPLPLLAMIWILVAFTPEFAKAFGVTVALPATKAIVFCYIGMTLGDAASGLLSQALHSRRRAIALFMVLLSAFVAAHLTLQPETAELYYAFCAAMGFAGGYWILAIQMGAELFGTNLRATAATSIPTMARGALLIPITMGFKALTPVLGVTLSGAAVMAVTLLLAALSLLSLKESFHRDLDFVE